MILQKYLNFTAKLVVRDKDMKEWMIEVFQIYLLDILNKYSTISEETCWNKRCSDVPGWDLWSCLDETNEQSVLGPAEDSKFWSKRTSASKYRRHKHAVRLRTTTQSQLFRREKQYLSTSYVTIFVLCGNYNIPILIKMFKRDFIKFYKYQWILSRLE